MTRTDLVGWLAVTARPARTSLLQVFMPSPDPLGQRIEDIKHHMRMTPAYRDMVLRAADRDFRRFA